MGEMFMSGKKEYIERGALIRFVKQNTPNIHGDTTMRCVERALKAAPATTNVVRVDDLREAFQAYILEMTSIGCHYQSRLKENDMTERERLIHLLCNVNCNGAYRRDGGCPFRQDELCNRIEKLELCMVERLADHLLANGVIVPPCKVEDTVYVCFSRTSVIECRVAQIIIENVEEIGMSFICYGGMRFDMRHWGKTVFLTRWEAERALKESEGET